MEYEGVTDIIVGVLETVPKNFGKKLEELHIKGSIKTVQNPALLRFN